jgi:hypothetical protein
MVAVAAAEVGTGMWLSALHFAIGGSHSRTPVQPNLQQSRTRNKTTRLEKWEGLRFDGD